MKRAFFDSTLEARTELLRCKTDIEIVQVSESPVGYGTVRFHLRGDGLPEKTRSRVGYESHQFDSLEEVCDAGT